MILITEKKKYKEAGQRLGIPGKNGMFLTGQHKSKENPNGLSQQEIKNPDIIPPERRPAYVITPDTYLKITHMRSLDDDDPETEAIRGLLPFQSNIAMSKKEYNPALHDWYIANPVKDEEEKSSKLKATKRAWDKVQSSSETKQKTLLLFANTRISGHSIQPKALNADNVYNLCVDLAQQHPGVVNEFFDTKNNQVQAEISILELIHYGILRQHQMHYYDGNNFVGRNAKEVLDYLNDPKNVGTKDRLFKILNQKKTGSIDNAAREIEVESFAAESLLQEAKASYVDENYDDSLSKVKKAISLNLDDETREKVESFRLKVLEAITGNKEKNALDLQNMSESAIKTFFKKSGIRGWKQDMTKEELIKVYKSS